MRAVALGRPAASVDELPIAPRYLRADWLQTNRHVCFWHKADMLKPLTIVRFWGQSGH
jgi:hypothetical protein